LFGLRKSPGFTRYQAAKTLYTFSATLVDDLLTVVYKAAENKASVNSKSEKQVSLKDLEEIINYTVQLTYKKLDNI
jgi:hypothetical protein